MTNKEALQSIVTYDLSTNFLDKVLLDNSVIGIETYISDNKNIIELCSAYCYKIIATHPDFRQGSLQISNRQAENFKKLANNIFIKYGKNNKIFGLPKIQLQIL